MIARMMCVFLMVFAGVVIGDLFNDRDKWADQGIYTTVYIRASNT